MRGSWPRLLSVDHKWRRRLVPIAFCLSVAATGCASGTGTPDATGAPPSVPSATTPAAVRPTFSNVPSYSAPGTTPDAASTELLVLADGVEGGVGLWSYGGGSWTPQWALPAATVLGRDGQTLVLAVGGSLQMRPTATPEVVSSNTAPTWSGKPAGTTIVGVDRSDSGATAIVVSQSGNLMFNLVATGGSVGALVPAPVSPFGPSVAWLDESRLAVISSDGRQVPRLAVVDTAKRTIGLLTGLSGVREFSLSPDRRTLAADTESAVYVAPVADWLANKEPSQAFALDPSQVVWDLALSADGTRLALLSGTENASGDIGDVHEITYRHSASGWSQSTDSAVPFAQAYGQAWLD
jgi:hypothetical protein